MSPTETLAKTPLFDAHVAAGGRMVAFAGYEMPVQYQGVKAEHLMVRSAVGLFDVSHMGELILTGSSASRIVQSLITNNASKLTDGKAQYTCCCNEAGTILDDLIVYRREENDWLIVCNASNRDKIVKHVQNHLDDACTLEDVSDSLALIAVQGPKAFESLATVAGGAALRDLGRFAHTRTTLAGHEVTVARTGYTGEDGVEIFCPAAGASALWETLAKAAGTHGGGPAGLGARDTLRLEAKLALYGNDIDETTNPYEAGLGWTVKLKAGDFIGRDALALVKEQGVKRKLVGFEMQGRGIARHGYPLLKTAGSEPIGTCTSGGPAPTVAKNIGLGYLPTPLAELGTEFVVDCRGREIPARVVATPFYKRS